MMNNEFWKDRWLRSIPRLHLTPNADLSPFTTMNTRATASLLAIPEDPYALRDLIKLVREREWPLLILGGGSNTIFATPEFEGVVVILDKALFGQMERVDENMVRIGAAADIKSLLPWIKTQNLMGLEFMTMIPGTVGGALAGNAGAGNWGLCDFAERVVVMTRSGRLIELQRGDFRFSYRYSELSEGIVLEADFLLEPRNEELAREKTRDFARKKKGQPYNQRSSGCVFKNPRDPRTGRPVSAGKLIDEAGMKGYSLGHVEVSDGHANFLINKGGASGEAFLAMISLIQDVIQERTGVQFDIEARIVGGPLTSCILR